MQSLGRAVTHKGQQERSHSGSQDNGMESPRWAAASREGKFGSKVKRSCLVSALSQKTFHSPVIFDFCPGLMALPK